MICKHVHLLYRYRERSGNLPTESSDNVETELDKDRVDDLAQLTSMIKEPEKSTLEKRKKNTENVLLEILGLLKDSDSRHIQAIRQLFKGTTALRNTFESMKKNVSVVKLDPIIKAPANKNIEQQRRVFSTLKIKKDCQCKICKTNH